MITRKNTIIIKTLDGEVVGIRDSYKRNKQGALPEYESHFKSEKIANVLAKEFKDRDIGSIIILYHPKNIWVSQKNYINQDGSGRNLVEIVTCKFSSLPSIQSLVQVIFTFLSNYSVNDEIILAENIEKVENYSNLSIIKSLLKSLFSESTITVKYTNHPLENELFHAFLVSFYWIGTCTPFAIFLNSNEKALQHSEYFPGRIINIVQDNVTKVLPDKEILTKNEFDDLFNFIQENYKDKGSFVDLMLKISSALPDDNIKNRYNKIIVKYIISIDKNINESIIKNNTKLIFDLPKWLKKDQAFEKTLDNEQNIKAIELFRYHYLIRKLDSRIIDPEFKIQGYELPLVLCDAEDIGYLYLNTNGFTTESYDYFLEIFERYKQISPTNLESFKAISDIYIFSVKNDIKLLNKYISQGLFDPSFLTKDDWNKIWNKYKKHSKKIIEDLLESTTENISMGLAEFILVDNVWDEFIKKLNKNTIFWLIEKLPHKILTLSKTRHFLDPLIKELNINQLKKLALSIPQNNNEYNLNPDSSFKIMKYICDEGLDTSIERMISLFFFTKEDKLLRINSLILLINWLADHNYTYNHWPQKQNLFSTISNLLEELLIKDFNTLIKYLRLLPQPWELNNYQLPIFLKAESVYKEITISKFKEDEKSRSWLLMILSSFNMEKLQKLNLHLFFQLNWTKTLINNKQSLTFWEKFYTQMPKDRIPFFLAPLLICAGSSKISVQPAQIPIYIKFIKEYIANIKSLSIDTGNSINLLQKLNNMIDSIDRYKHESLINQFAQEVSKYVHNIIDDIVIEINIADNASLFYKFLFVHYFKKNKKAWCKDSLLELLIRISKTQHEFLLEVSNEVKSAGKLELLVWIGYLLAKSDLCNPETYELIRYLRKRINQDWPMFADTILIENSNDNDSSLLIP